MQEAAFYTSFFMIFLDLPLLNLMLISLIFTLLTKFQQTTKF